MNIATALNRKYLPYTIVMLTSLCENNTVHIDAFLLNTELTSSDLSQFREALAVYDIVCHDIKVDSSRFDGRCPHNEKWTLEAYYRLMLPDLLPKAVDRILYLDVDLIVNQSLEDMYAMDLGGMDIWACENCNGTTVPEIMPTKQQEMFTPFMAEGYRYFNSGVMLINLSQLRMRDIMDDYQDAMEVWEYAMDCPDQDILNYVHRDTVGYLPWKKYDLFAKQAHQVGISLDEVQRDTAIIHYAGSKPWNTTNLHFDLEQIWWDYAKRTPCYRMLLESFQHSVMMNQTIEAQIRELADANHRLVEISHSLAARLQGGLQ